MVAGHICAKNVFEVLAGNKQTHYINYFDKDLDNLAKGLVNAYLLSVLYFIFHSYLTSSLPSFLYAAPLLHLRW